MIPMKIMWQISRNSLQDLHSETANKFYNNCIKYHKLLPCMCVTDKQQQASVPKVLMTTKSLRWKVIQGSAPTEGVD